MSGTLVAMALQSLGVPAISLTGAQAGIRTDSSHGRARIANVDPVRVQDEIAAGKIVIVAGFQGATDESHRTGEVTTLGRGGSDTTAVALAARLGADRCEIYTDVEGIFTTDPRVVPDARLLPVIGYEEMLELAHQGAQVMQTRAVELGWVNGVVIASAPPSPTTPARSSRRLISMELRDKVRGLALDRKVAKIDPRRGAGPAGHRARRVRPAGRVGHQHRPHRPERGPRGGHRPVVHGAHDGAGTGPPSARPGGA